MIAELFETIEVGNPRGPMLLHGMREELQRELSAAVNACDEVPGQYLDIEEAKRIFKALAADGDDFCARENLLECFCMSAGCGAHFDRMMDFVNTIGWAYWRLHRAERRAYGKETAR